MKTYEQSNIFIAVKNWNWLHVYISVQSSAFTRKQFAGTLSYFLNDSKETFPTKKKVLDKVCSC